MEYTREDLIEICKKGRVLYNNWKNRDSCSAQKDLMLAGLLLESGCDFRIRTKSEGKDKSCVTNDNTIWIDIYYDSWEDGETWNLFYLPTLKRLDDGQGKDWY